MTDQHSALSDWRCPSCGWMVDTPEHQHGCAEGRYAALKDRERADAIRESNQRAGGDNYGG